MIPKLYDYQRDYFRNVKRNWIYDMDTGTGKTIMGLTHYKIFYEDLPLTIYAPASKVKEGGWQRAIEKFKITNPVKVISYNKIKDNYLNEKNGFVIFDEGHRVKDSTGVWGKTAFSITKNYCAGFILLTATPLTNGWIDSINYLKMFGYVRNKTQFLKAYTIVDNSRGYPEIVAWRNTKSLGKFWQNISKRLNKEDAFDLPELVEKEIMFVPSPKYLKIKTARIDGDNIYDNMFSWRHGLRANVSTWSKTEYIKELVEDISGNIIIFYNYNSELEEIKKVLKNKTVFECNGYSKNYPKEPEWKTTKNSITLANYKSGSEGIEFTYADKIIFFSPPESYTDYYQAIGRVHRLGQGKKVTIYKLNTHETIEESIYKSLENKEDFCFERWFKDGK
jgi:SNF2 family DNA or RNA helicase